MNTFYKDWHFVHFVAARVQQVLNWTRSTSVHALTMVAAASVETVEEDGGFDKLASKRFYIEH